MQFRNRNMTIIWNKLKMHKKLKLNSNLKADDFETHFSSLMKDDEPHSVEQLKIQTTVRKDHPI